jgi:hypothetical protein
MPEQLRIPQSLRSFGMTMRSFAVLAFIPLAACAPSQSPGTPQPEDQTVRVRGMTDASGLRMTSNTMAKTDTLWTPFDAVWKALPSVYATLEIPIEQFNAETNTIGNSALKLYRRLGKFPLTRYLDCGQTQIGPNADSYEVMLSVLTTIRKARADSANTVVSTTVSGMARPIQFRGDYVQCSSKGALENRFLEVLKVQLSP